MDFKDYYKILGLDHNADSKAIKTAYRKLARMYHPDMNSDKGAEDKFKDVAEAYQVLKDPQRRAEFDELRQYGAQAGQGFQPPPGWQGSTGSQHRGSEEFNEDYSDFFNSFFRGRHQSEQAQDVEVELPLDLEDTVNDTPKTIEYFLSDYQGGQNRRIKKHLKVTIPEGVVDGEIIRLKGQGSPGGKNISAGDLYLHVRINPHRLFEVDGHDLVLTLPLAPWEAALGANITIPTLTGKIKLSISPNTPAGKKLRIKGRGLKYRNKNHTNAEAGDLFAIVKIVMPKTQNENDKKMWRELAAHQNFEPRAQWGL